MNTSNTLPTENIFHIRTADNPAAGDCKFESKAHALAAARNLARENGRR
jgi:hypothetical protein